MSQFWPEDIFSWALIPWCGVLMSPLGPKGPILVPCGTLAFLLTFSSKSADEPRMSYLARKHFSLALMSLGLGPNGSQGPYFGHILKMCNVCIFIAPNTQLGLGFIGKKQLIRAEISNNSLIQFHVGRRDIKSF